MGGDIRFDCEQYALAEIPSKAMEKISVEEMHDIQKLIPKAEFEFPFDNDKLVSFYPNASEMADIDEVGEISNKFLDSILSKEYICKEDEINTLIRALSGLKHERLWEIADYFLWRSSYISHLEQSNMTIIVKALMKLPRTEELENYLIEIMVEYEQEYPSIKKLIMNYF